MNRKGTCYTGISIDPSEAKIIEDAFWVSFKKDKYIVKIFIPLVSSIVKKWIDEWGTFYKAYVHLSDQLRVKHYFFSKFEKNRLNLSLNVVQDSICFKFLVNSDFIIEEFLISECKFRNLYQFNHDELSVLLQRENFVNIQERDFARVLGFARQLAIGFTQNLKAEFFSERGKEMQMNIDYLVEKQIGNFIIHRLMESTNRIITNFAIHNDIPLLFNRRVVPSLMKKKMNLVKKSRTKVPFVDISAPFTSPIRDLTAVANQMNLLAFLHNETFPLSRNDMYKITLQ